MTTKTNVRINNGRHHHQGVGKDLLRAAQSAQELRRLPSLDSSGGIGRIHLTAGKTTLEGCTVANADMKEASNRGGLRDSNEKAAADTP